MPSLVQPIRITTTLEQLRMSGRVCPHGYGRLLRSQGKQKADDEPINVADLIPYLGHHEVMRGLNLFPQHEAACRAFAVSIAAGCSHLIFDRKEVEGSHPYSPWIEAPVDEWQYLKAKDLAVLALATTAIQDGTKAPFFAAMATELALSRSAPSAGVGWTLVDLGTEEGPEDVALKWKAIEERGRMIDQGIPAPEDHAARQAAEAKHTAMLKGFLSGR